MIFDRSNSMDKIGIKIVPNNKLIKGISSIRKYTDLSIKDIKDKIMNREYVMSCGYTEEDGIKRIVEAYKEITGFGVEVEIYEHNRITTLEFLLNLINMYEDIERDMQEIDDLMYDDED